MMKLTDADMESWNKWAEEEHDDYHNQHDRTLHQESVITNTRLQQTGNSKSLGRNVDYQSSAILTRKKN